MKYLKTILITLLIIPTMVWGASIFDVYQGGTGNTTFTSSQLLYGVGAGAIQSVATSSKTCTAPLSCTGFDIVGSGAGAITIDGTGYIEVGTTSVDSITTLGSLSLPAGQVTGLSYYTDADVSTYLTGGTGITESSGTISFDCSEVEGTGINCATEAITLDNTGAWAGTLSSFGTDFYSYFNATNTDALSQGSTNKYATQSTWDSFWNASTTLDSVTSIPNLTGYDAVTTAGDGLTRTLNDFDCDTASGSVFGCLSAANWNTFNDKQAALGYIPLNQSTYFSTTTQNTITTLPSLALPIAQVTGMWTYPFPSAATSTPLTFTGLFTTTNATSTLFSTGYASSTLGYFGTAYIPNLGTAAGSFLAVNATGQIISTTTPTGGSGISTTLTKGWTLVGSDANVAQATSSLFMSSVGNVGIGTTSPLARLSVSNYSTGANTKPLFVVASSTGTGATSTAFIIDSSGNVGIGTAEPTRLLHVAGAVSVGTLYPTGDIRFTSITSPLIYNNSSGSEVNLKIIGATGANSFLTLQSTYGVGTSDYIKFLVGNNGATEAMRINTSGSVGIGTTTPGMKFAVHGDALADSWNVYSDIYKGDALTGLKGIKAEAGTTGNWVKVDHNTLPDGILKNTPQTYYEDYYKPILKEISAEERMLGGLATTTEITGYKKISDGTIISTSTYNKLLDTEKGITHNWTLQTMSISGLAQMNTRAIQQLDERLLKLEVVKLGSINSQGNFDKEQLKQEIINELKPDIQRMVNEAIDRKINSMSFVEKLKLLFK